MASRLILTALGATLALGIISPAMAANNLITNGDFEDQVGFTGSGYDYANNPTGWTTNAAWDASAYNAVKGGVYGQPYSGLDSVRFGASTSSAPTTLSQTFSDVVGGQYTVSFYAYNGQYAGVSGSRPYNYLTASAGGQSITLADNVGGTTGASCGSDCYALGTFTFIGTGSDTLSIAAKTDSNYWQLDDVSVTGGSLPSGVPEPATWAMMIGGFGLTGVAMRRGRRSGLSALA
jgi:hypothetical protein